MVDFIGVGFSFRHRLRAFRHNNSHWNRRQNGRIPAVRRRRETATLRHSKLTFMRARSPVFRYPPNDQFEPLFDDPASFIEGLLLPIHSTDLGNV